MVADSTTQMTMVENNFLAETDAIKAVPVGALDGAIGKVVDHYVLDTSMLKSEAIIAAKLGVTKCGIGTVGYLGWTIGDDWQTYSGVECAEVVALDVAATATVLGLVAIGASLGAEVQLYVL